VDTGVNDESVVALDMVRRSGTGRGLAKNVDRIGRMAKADAHGKDRRAKAESMLQFRQAFKAVQSLG
jgi:hypothetical protein